MRVSDRKSIQKYKTMIGNISNIKGENSFKQSTVENVEVTILKKL